MCELERDRFTKISVFIMEVGAHSKILATPHVMPHLPQWIQNYFGMGMRAFLLDDFQKRASEFVVYAQAQYEKAVAVLQNAWVRWALDSLCNCAARAHRATKAKDLQSILDKWKTATLSAARDARAPVR